MPSLPRWAWFPFGAVLRTVARNARRVAVSIVGFTLVALGLILLALPGPGVALLVAGLAVLATEYVWAQRALNVAKRAAATARDRALRRRRPETSPRD